MDQTSYIVPAELMERIVSAARDGLIVIEMHYANNCVAANSLRAALAAWDAWQGEQTKGEGA